MVGNRRFIAVTILTFGQLGFAGLVSSLVGCHRLRWSNVL
jgi:hypothetical protein